MPLCAPSELRAELVDAQHGAGQTHATLALVNTGGQACEVGGRPVVFQVDEAGTRRGQPAAAEGPAGAAVLLAAGERAEAGLTVSAAGLFPACGADGSAVPPAGLRVIPPGGGEALTVDGLAALLPLDAGAVSAGAGCPEPALAELRVTALYPAI
ncbi:Protein of unknown function (DUF4232) [Frankia sp. EI5c]|nr:Protein of unknown function (DUF4232) [Frankia sp. EI5c]